VLRVTARDKKKAMRTSVCEELGWSRDDMPLEVESPLPGVPARVR
jgi:hypothetical protein